MSGAARVSQHDCACAIDRSGSDATPGLCCADGLPAANSHHPRHQRGAARAGYALPEGIRPQLLHAVVATRPGPQGCTPSAIRGGSCESVCNANGMGDRTRPRIVQRDTAASAVQRRADHILVAVRLWIAFHERAAAGDVALRHCHSQPASSQTEKTRSGG